MDKLRLPLTLVALLALGLSGCASSPTAEELAENSRRARSHYQLASDHLKNGRSAMAIRELLAAEQLDPEDAWIQVALAEAYRLRGFNEECEQHLRNALELKPDMQIARLNLSALYVQIGRYEDAIEQTQILLDDPTFPVPWKALVNQGWAYYKLGDREQARAKLNLALEFDEHFWPAWLDLAIMDAEDGNKLEALDGFEKVIAVQPGPLAEAEAHYRMAEVYIALGNRNKAMHHLSTASQTKPSGEWGKRSEDYLRRLR